MENGSWERRSLHSGLPLRAVTPTLPSPKSHRWIWIANPETPDPAKACPSVARRQSRPASPVGLAGLRALAIAVKVALTREEPAAKLVTRAPAQRASRALLVRIPMARVRTVRLPVARAQVARVRVARAQVARRAPAWAVRERLPVPRGRPARGRKGLPCGEWRPRALPRPRRARSAAQAPLSYSARKLCQRCMRTARSGSSNALGSIASNAATSTSSIR